MDMLYSPRWHADIIMHPLKTYFQFKILNK